MPDDSIYINGKSVQQQTYDAIVIGSGISGGWAAKELCEKGLKTLVLERGRNVRHLKDYPTATLHPWQFPHRGQCTKAQMDANPLISKAAGYDETTSHFFVKDADHPYVQEKPFDWIRGYQVGGKSLIWGRACPRWSGHEFSSPARDGYGIEWPFSYDEIAPWYSHVERFAGICGNRDGLEIMPDGEYMPPVEFNCAEKEIKNRMSRLYPDRHLVQGRWAQLTAPGPIHREQGRGKCQSRDLCMRGCPFGGYFSSNSSTLPWAEKTGNLTIRPFSVAHSIIYDEKKGRAAGVRVVDAETKQSIDFFSKIIFVCASALNSNLVLLNSVSNRFPTGFGNDSGLLGKYVGFQNYRGFSMADLEGLENSYYSGHKVAECMVPNFRNIGKHRENFVGGYMAFAGCWRDRGGNSETQSIGEGLKTAMSEPGGWHMYMYCQGETVMKENNQVRLSSTEKDPFGIPKLVINVGYDDNDEKMVGDFLMQSAEMFDRMGLKNIQSIDNHWSPGRDIHEMGGCRAGKDPKTSLLNKWHQFHACKNVFVTDGAGMTSTGYGSPSILYMAFTARAANYAVEELKKGNI